jgi:hypothetical protein
MNRSTSLVLLFAFVVALAAALLVVTGGVGRILPPTAHPSSAPSSSPTTVVAPVCTSGELKLLGAFNDCAGTAPSTTSGCRVSGGMLDAYITLDGIKRDYLLYVEVDGSYVGPGDYSLPPWPHSLGSNDGTAKVAIRDYQTGALWESNFGVLTVSGGDGRSGLVTAGLTSVGGEAIPRAQGLKISGRWSCA